VQRLPCRVRLGAKDQLAPKPADLSFEQAAAVPISAFAALQALRDTAGVRPGRQVVIIGASAGLAASRCS
jgi:NADPH:quinone reductase-like Zn-dependent oxidoreductase